jgi:hypothetical protein
MDHADIKGHASHVRYDGIAANVAFFHPDYTVGPGISPGLLTRVLRRAARGLGPKAIPPVGTLTLP